MPEDSYFILTILADFSGYEWYGESVTLAQIQLHLATPAFFRNQKEHHMQPKVYEEYEEGKVQTIFWLVRM